MITNLSIGRYGRFGNALFQIAAVIGIARKSGQPFGFIPFINHDHKDRFGSTEDIELDKYFINPLPQIAGDYPYLQKKDYSWGYHDINLSTGNWDISGHFQSEKYFKQCIDEVRHYFKMIGELPLNQVVAIHVRLGDYDNNYHPRLGLDYYAKAMKQFPEGTVFKLFSDDLVAAIEMLKDQSDYIFPSEGKSYIEDFKLMKTCRSFITGNSSYSLMAAILGDHPDKKVVCPSNWFGPAWGSGYKEMAKDIYPENAIII